jgi:hypothetical protein
MNEPDKSRRNVAASVRARLLNKARAEKLDFNLLLTRYALERVLYRLSVSEQHGQLSRIWKTYSARSARSPAMTASSFRPTA